MDIIKIFSGGFPLTTNRLIFLQQTYAKAFAQITKIAGSGDYIIDGAKVDDVANPTVTTDGVIVLAGEVLEFRGGDFDARVAVFEETVTVPYNEDLDNNGDLDLKVADTVRFATCAAVGGSGAVNYSSLNRFGKLQDLNASIGETKTGFFTVAPTGWLFLDGQTLQQSEYPQLFALLGTAYGEDGVGTFKLPDARNKFTVIAGDEYLLGGSGGAKEVTLQESEMPIHNHDGNVVIPPHSHTYTQYQLDQEVSTNGSGVRALNKGNNQVGTFSTSSTASQNANITTSSKGGGTAHENRPPFLAENKIIFAGFRNI